MSLLPKGGHHLRIIALPLARIKASTSTKLRPNSSALVVFYHFDLVFPYAGRRDLPWHKKVLRNVVSRAADLWTGLGKAPKGSWKLWTYDLGERIADSVEFEELALRNIDPSLGPVIETKAEQVDGNENDRSPSHPLLPIPFIYPPSLYQQETDHALQPPLAHLQTLLTCRAPQHRRKFYLWMFIAPITLPIALIPIVPNLPFFFCVWRSWSHYRAYRSSQYLSSLLDRGLIEPNPSLELDELYASFISSSRSFPSASPATKFSEKLSTPGYIATDRKPETASRTGASGSECILLTREAVPRIWETFNLPASAAVDIRRAMNQAHVRLGRSH